MMDENIYLRFSSSEKRLLPVHGEHGEMVKDEQGFHCSKCLLILTTEEYIDLEWELWNFLEEDFEKLLRIGEHKKIEVLG